MSTSSARRPRAWIPIAHVLGAAAIGALEALRLGSAGLALALVPLFAATGLIIGLVIAGADRLVDGRRWWVAALGLAAPSLLVLVPVASTLFVGAYAQTLPLASALPVLLPLAGWGAIAAAIAGGRRIARAPDLTTRALLILGCAGALGAIVWGERNVLRSGYPGAHAGAMLAVLVLAGIAVRVARRATPPWSLAAGLAVVVVGAAVAATLTGLTEPHDRRVLATMGDHGRDLVRLWRQVLDVDRDGSSPVLGGGDCDDGDPARHPGAADLPGDGVDQDCDGQDAAPPPPPAARPSAAELAAWRASPAVRAVLDRTRDMNVLLVTVDALRFDVLAPDTADRGEFPHLTKLLDDSVWFTRAIAPGSGTDISIGTLLTGRADPFQRVDTTLPEALRGLGLRTYSAVPVEVNRYVGDTLLKRGIDKRTPVYTDWGTKDVGDHVSAPQTTLEGLRAFDDAAGKRAFVWLHYFDVHEHHQIQVPRALRAAVQPTGGDKRHAYRALLFAIDQELGRLRAALEARGLADRTIIVFASDHGESLGEDPRLGDTHGKVTYAALVRIPLAIHVPGVPGARRPDPVSIVDLAPTVLALLGSPTAMAPLDGIDLVPAVLGAPGALHPGGRAIVVQDELQWSVVEWPYQLLVRAADDLVELYDLERDPAQRADLAATRPELVTRLRARYAEVPRLTIDRTPDGRRSRERLAQPPPRRAPPPAGAATSTP